MSDAAALIGIAKPRPSALVDDRGVDADDRARVASSSGPPLLPGLIAASVWMRPVSVVGAAGRLVLDGDRPAERGQDPAGDGLGVGAERAADRDGGLADLERRRVADRRGGQAGGVDLDQGEVLSLEILTSVASNWRPSASSTVSDWLAPSTTWRLVRM